MIDSIAKLPKNQNIAKETRWFLLIKKKAGTNEPIIKSKDKKVVKGAKRESDKAKLWSMFNREGCG